MHQQGQRDLIIRIGFSGGVERLETLTSQSFQSGYPRGTRAAVAGESSLFIWLFGT
jgi:hypothetical protein